MRIGELSGRTGVPVPTIKYYLRENLLPAGELTSPNQAQYDERHVRRLKLVRALLEAGGLSIAAAQELVAAIDAPDVSLPDTLGVAQRAVSPPPSPCEGSAPAAGRAGGRRLGTAARLAGGSGQPGRLLAGPAAAHPSRAWPGGPARPAGRVRRGGRAAGRVELALLGRKPEGARVEGAVLGTVLGDALLATLRRLAQENAARRLA